MIAVEGEAMVAVPLSITKTTSHDDKWVIVASIGVPELINKQIDELTYCISFDSDYSHPNFSKTYIDQRTGEVVPVNSSDLDYVINKQFLPIIDKMLDEKIYNRFAV